MNITYTLAKLLEKEVELVRVEEFPIITNNTKIKTCNKKKFPGIHNINYEELMIELTEMILKSNKINLLSGYLEEIYDFIPSNDLEELVRILYELNPGLREAEVKSIQSFINIMNRESDRINIKYGGYLPTL